jgi:hypothetical protein
MLFYNSSIVYIYKRLRQRKKIRNRKKKEQQKFLMKFNTKPLKFKYGLADGGGGGGGWSTHARHGYPHLVLNKTIIKTYLKDILLLLLYSITVT